MSYMSSLLRLVITKLQLSWGQFHIDLCHYLVFLPHKRRDVCVGSKSALWAHPQLTVHFVS